MYSQNYCFFTDTPYRLFCVEKSEDTVVKYEIKDCSEIKKIKNKTAVATFRSFLVELGKYLLIRIIFNKKFTSVH